VAWWFDIALAGQPWQLALLFHPNQQLEGHEVLCSTLIVACAEGGRGRLWQPNKNFEVREQLLHLPFIIIESILNHQYFIMDELLFRLILHGFTVRPSLITI